MSKLKDCKTMRFKPAKQKEMADEIINPERGWYQIHTFTLGENVVLNDREYTLNTTDTLAFVLIDISKYRDCLLDEKALKDLRSIFDFFVDYRLDMIVRVVYDLVGKCMETEPDNEELILEHMKQLGPVFKEYSSHIFVYQGLLIGNWGEMHSSKFLTPSRLKRLADEFMHAFEDSAFLALRRPSYVRILYSEGEDLLQKKVGVFDDAIMASETHLGTFGNETKENARREVGWHSKDEKEYLDMLNRLVPYGGEAIFENEPDSLSKIRRDLKATANYLSKLHVSYLNRVYDSRFLDNLRSMTWEGHDVFKGLNGYDYIGRRLGYRFFLKSVEVKPLQGNPGLYRWSLKVANRGFSKVFFENSVFLIGMDELGRKQRIDISDWVDFRTVEPDSEHEFMFNTEAILGDIFMEVYKKSTGQIVYFANRTESGAQIRSLYLGIGK